MLHDFLPFSSLRFIALICRAVMLSLSCLLLLSCQPQQQVQLRIGTNLWPGYEPLYVARDRQVFQGLDLQLIEYRAAGQVINGLRKGTINMAAVTLDEAVRIAASGIPVEVIWLFNISDGADQLLARPGINNINELKGKKIGVESNALGAYLLQRFFSLHQLSPADYQVVGLDLAAHAQAMEHAEVDAVMTFEPEKSKMLRQGATALFTSREVPGEVMDVLIVRKDGPDVPTEAQLQQFIRQYHQLFSQMEADLPAWYDALNRRMKLSPDELAQTYRELQIPSVAMQRTILDNKSRLADVIKGYETVLLQIGMIEKPCACSALINTKYLETLP
jgi:NitT/TauT family transport system substrate-binding protein